MKLGFVLLIITLLSGTMSHNVNAQTNDEILFPDYVDSMEYITSNHVKWDDSTHFKIISALKYTISNVNEDTFDVSFSQTVKVDRVSGIDIVGIEVVFDDYTTQRFAVDQNVDAEFEITRRVDKSSGKILEVIADTKKVEEVKIIYQFDYTVGIEQEYVIGKYTQTGFVPYTWTYVFEDINEATAESGTLNVGGTQFDCFVIDLGESTYFCEKSSGLTMQWLSERYGLNWQVYTEYRMTQLNLRERETVQESGGIPGFSVLSIGVALLAVSLSLSSAVQRS